MFDFSPDCMYTRTMTNAQRSDTVARQIAYFTPADARGKWHAAWMVTHTPVCGAWTPLGTDAIRTAQGQEIARVHRIVCRRCLKLSAVPGVSAEGVKR